MHYTQHINRQCTALWWEMWTQGVFYWVHFRMSITCYLILGKGREGGQKNIWLFGRKPNRKVVKYRGHLLTTLSHNPNRYVSWSAVNWSYQLPVLFCSVLGQVIELFSVWLSKDIYCHFHFPKERGFFSLLVAYTYYGLTYVHDTHISMELPWKCMYCCGNVIIMSCATFTVMLALKRTDTLRHITQQVVQPSQSQHTSLDKKQIWLIGKLSPVQQTASYLRGQSGLVTDKFWFHLEHGTLELIKRGSAIKYLRLCDNTGRDI